MSGMMLGIMEVIMHTAMIRMFRLKHFYSPGLVTAVFILLPIPLYTFTFGDPTRFHASDLVAIFFSNMLFGPAVAQQIVIRASGVKYADFLKNVRAALVHKS